VDITGEGTVRVIGESDDTDTAIDTDFGNLRTAFVDLDAVTLAQLTAMIRSTSPQTVLWMHRWRDPDHADYYWL